MAKLDKAPNNFRGMSPIDAECHAICKVWLTPSLTPISPTRTPTRPRLPVTNPDFDYVPSRATNVQSTWRKFGWKPLNTKETHE